jgi:hypothetical protein
VRLASTEAGSVEQVLVEQQQGQTRRCNSFAITSGVISGFSIT